MTAGRASGAKTRAGEARKPQPAAPSGEAAQTASPGSLWSSLCYRVQPAGADPTEPSPGGLASDGAGAGRVIQRKCACGGSGEECAECASRRVQRAADGGGGPRTAPVAAGTSGAGRAVESTLRGAPLPEDVRAYFETRFSPVSARPGHLAPQRLDAGLAVGAPDDPAEREANRASDAAVRAAPGARRVDFSAVRVHSDATAADSARSLHAHAYTAGQHVAFAAGRYQPRSTEGRALLGHELAHTLQQGASAPVVQRATPEDFQVRGIFPSSGDPEYRDFIFFDYASEALVSFEANKLARLVPATATEVHLHGFASEEGDAAFNAGLVNRRIAAVQAALRGAPINLPTTARVVSHPRPGDRERDPDYRRWRCVQVIVGADRAPPGSCDRQPQAEACGALLGTVRNQAITMLSDAIRRTRATTADDVRDRALGSVFPGVPAGDVAAGLQRIHDHLQGVLAMPSDHTATPGTATNRLVCGTRCHPDCLSGFTAMNHRGSSSGNFVVLCPDFFEGVTAPATGASPSRELIHAATILAHESSHGTPSMRSTGDPDRSGTEDLAYRWNRLIRHLGRRALGNAGSYDAYIELLAGGSVSLGAGAADRDLFGTPDPAGRFQTASVAVAQAERWMASTSAQVEMIYSSVQAAISRPGETARPIDPTGWTAWYLGELDRRFGIKVARTDDIVARPRREHAWRLAGVASRYGDVTSLTRRPLSFGPMASGDVGWAVAAPPATGPRATAPPRPGETVLFGPGFFGADPPERVRMVLRAAMAGTSSIRAALAPHYLSFAEEVRAQRDLPPP